MFARPSFRILKPTVAYRSITHTTATLRISKDVTPQEVDCVVGGAPDYSVGVPKEIGCALAGRDLGYRTATVDLVFYDGRHLGIGMPPSSLLSLENQKQLSGPAAVCLRVLGDGVNEWKCKSLMWWARGGNEKDKDPASPRLTLKDDVAHLLDRDHGADVPAKLFHSAELDGSGIALEGSEGGE